MRDDRLGLLQDGFRHRHEADPNQQTVPLTDRQSLAAEHAGDLGAQHAGGDEFGLAVAIGSLEPLGGTGAMPDQGVPSDGCVEVEPARSPHALHLVEQRIDRRRGPQLVGGTITEPHRGERSGGDEWQRLVRRQYAPDLTPVPGDPAGLAGRHLIEHGGGVLTQFAAGDALHVFSLRRISPRIQIRGVGWMRWVASVLDGDSRFTSPLVEWFRSPGHWRALGLDLSRWPWKNVGVHRHRGRACGTARRWEWSSSSFEPRNS